MISFYDKFEIDDFSGVSLNNMQLIDLQYKKIQNLQRIAFQKFPELKDLALSSVKLLENRETLQMHLERVICWVFDVTMIYLFYNLSFLPQVIGWEIDRFGTRLGTFGTQLQWNSPIRSRNFVALLRIKAISNRTSNSQKRLSTLICVLITIVLT